MTLQIGSANFSEGEIDPHDPPLVVPLVIKERNLFLLGNNNANVNFNL
jgi:hypothetical protein